MPRQKDTYLNKEGLEYYHRKIKQEFASQEDLNNLSQVVDGKQDQLTSANAGSGIEITTDSQGNVVISNTNVSAEWGNIQGNITEQTDLINYIEQNGGKIDGISINGIPQQIVNKVIDISIPTKTSELVNDSDYVSDVNYVHTDNNFTSEEKNKLNSIENGAEVNVLEGITVNGVPQQITNKITNISVPTSTSQLVNDSGFITKNVNDLTNYYTKSETYTQEEVDNLIESITPGSSYTAGNGIDITNNVISLKNLILDCGTSITVIT